ncbi:hypothetical protein D782_2406 [Enterobacteriaceae bacterium strain FGI 57]|nr:hypothetical protein D782_2406 [Enterobacteriaceae bacterium strain FGI 57]
MFIPVKNKIHKCMSYEMFDDISLQEKKRLYLLENGVKNFSGGIINLRSRIDEFLSGDCADAEMLRILLGDLSAYLRDLQAVGQLDSDKWIL